MADLVLGGANLMSGPGRKRKQFSLPDNHKLRPDAQLGSYVNFTALMTS